MAPIWFVRRKRRKLYNYKKLFCTCKLGQKSCFIGHHSHFIFGKNSIRISVAVPPSLIQSSVFYPKIMVGLRETINLKALLNIRKTWSLTSMEGHEWQLFERRVLRKKYGALRGMKWVLWRGECLMTLSASKIYSVEWIGKDLEGSGRSPIEVGLLFRRLPGGTEENHENLWSRKRVSRPKVESRTSWKRIKSITQR
jgi:hypothetical protein